MEHELSGDRAVIIVSALVAISSSCSSVSKDNNGTGAFAETTCSSVHQKLLQLLNGEMSWKDNSFLLGLWPYQWMKHTVSQNGEFICRYYCLHPYLLPLSFCHYSYYVIINYISTSNDTKIQYILPSLIAVSEFMTDKVIQFNSTSD